VGWDGRNTDGTVAKRVTGVARPGSRALGRRGLAGLAGLLRLVALELGMPAWVEAEAGGGAAGRGVGAGVGGRRR
jgi:hypothetical protein